MWKDITAHIVYCHIWGIRKMVGQIKQLKLQKCFPFLRYDTVPAADVKDRERYGSGGDQTLDKKPVAVLDHYVTCAPNPQNALDLFKGEWASKLPAPLAHLDAGENVLFEDPRIPWAAEKLGGVNGKDVLELGPLEAGHTYMLEQLGAASILSVESNTRAFLKCLVIKELLGLEKAHFICGDFVEYLRSGNERFDVVIASGVLYHMKNPAELIALLSQATDKIFIWTHYYDRDLVSSNPLIPESKFGKPRPLNTTGFGTRCINIFMIRR
jgi:hypothetical protein